MLILTMGHLQLHVRSCVRESDSGGRDAPPLLKTGNYPNLQSVTKGSYVFLRHKKNFSLYKNKTGFADAMYEKKFRQNFFDHRDR